MGRAPENSGSDVDEYEKRLAHAQHANDAGNNRFHARHKAAYSNRFAAMQTHKVLAPLHQAGVTVQGPHGFETRAKKPACPIGKLVTDDRPQTSGNEYRPKRQMARPHQHACSHQHGSRWNKQPDDQKCLT